EAPGGYLADVGRRMFEASLERGVLLRPLGNVLYALPPLRTSDESLGRIAEAMRTAVLAAGRGSWCTWPLLRCSSSWPSPTRGTCRRRRGCGSCASGTATWC